VNIQGKAFFVTGAASGLGSAVAERLLKEGAYVAFADIDAATASACAAQYKHPVIQKYDLLSVMVRSRS
jgi:NAD(P)-dependent dehydrogenase (short-subunit alcohol dehydrogenase family)